MDETPLSASAGAKHRIRTKSDELGALLATAQQGDQEAYQTLLESIEPVIRAVVCRRIYGKADADEVIQDVMLSVHLARDSYEPDRSFGSWLQAIIHHRVVDYIRRVTRERRFSGNSIDQLDTHELERATAVNGLAEFRLDIEELINTLPANQRRLFDSLVSGEAQNEDLARQFETTAGNLRVQLHRLSMKFKERMRW